MHKTPAVLYATIALAALAEALLAIWQFSRQLGIDTPGVAKVLIGGGRLMRAYGNFPHPNVLAAFLILGLIGLFYFLEATWNWDHSDLIRVIRIGLSSAFFITGLGLILTFSRAAWLTAALMLVLWLFFNRTNLRTSQVLILTGGTLIILLAFGWLIFPRLQISSDEPALALRQTYNKIGLEIIQAHPLVGVGWGKQVAYAVDNGFYQKYGLNQEWQWQPVHNLYLLIAAEMGLPFFVLFIAFCAFLIYKAFLNYELRTMNYGVIMLIALLLLGLFDHFLWTLPSGRIMLVLVMGLTLISFRSSMDRMRASEARDTGSIPVGSTF